MSSRVYGGMLNLFLPSLISLKAISALGCFHGSLARLTWARLVRDRLRACIVCPYCIGAFLSVLGHVSLLHHGCRLSVVWGSVIGLAARIVIFYTIPVNQPLSGRIFHRRAR